LPTSPPSVHADRNRINILMSFLWVNSKIGQQGRVMPLSTFWDPNFAYHGSLPLTEPEPEFRTLFQLFFSELPNAVVNLYHLIPTFCLIPTHSLKLNLYHPCHSAHSTTRYLSWQWQLAQLTHPCPFHTHHTAVSTHHTTERDRSASSTCVLC